jgi:hypothetical protein
MNVDITKRASVSRAVGVWLQDRHDGRTSSSLFDLRAFRHTSGLSAYEIQKIGHSQHVSSEQRHKESSSRSLLFLRSATLLQSTPV